MLVVFHKTFSPITFMLLIKILIVQKLCKEKYIKDARSSIKNVRKLAIGKNYEKFMHLKKKSGNI